MIYWAPVLHLYQPPTQLPEVLRRICDECYRPLLRILAGLADSRLTLNVAGSLVEQLRQHQMVDVIDGLRALAEAGKVELTGSAMYHAILPLLPSREGRRQITLNQRTNRGAFGDAFRPAGFFPPELCFADSIVPTLLETGHRWVLVSGVGCPIDWPLDAISTLSCEVGELAVFYRDDVLSNRIAFADLDAESFLANLRALRGRRDNIYVVTAMDGETFGHHLPGWEEAFLARGFRLVEQSEPASEVMSTAPADRINVVTISSLLDRFPRTPGPLPRPSSWSTTGDDLAAGNAFPLWKDPGNRIHQLQWTLTDLALDLTYRAETLGDSEPSRRYARIARDQMDRALHSCQYWWASRRPMWDVNMVHRGLLEQQAAVLNAMLAIRQSNAPESVRAEATYRFVAAREIANRILDELIA